MDKTKLTSVRIDEDTLKKIEELAKSTHYWKRNSIINAVLTSIFFNAEHEDLMNLIRWWKHSSEKLKISVKP